MQHRRRPISNTTMKDGADFGSSTTGGPSPPSIWTNLFRSVTTSLAAVRAILNLPTFIIIVIAALDSADKGLLASSFPMLEKQLGMSVETLGYFSLFTNLSYSFALPLWGWCVHRYTIKRSPSILAGSCALWGVSTLGIAVAGSSVGAQALFRSINGGAVASILPLSQMLLVEFVPSNMLGRAFGLMGLAEKLAGTFASASIIWFSNWQMPYFAVGSLSLIAAAFAQRFLTVTGHHDGKGKLDEDDNKKTMTLGQIVRRITRIPAFLCLVGQGIFGGIPWDMMSFLLLLFEWRGLSREQIVTIQFTQGISGTIGTPIGGFLGDRFAHLPRGRIYVALTSVVLGTISFGIFLFSTSYKSIFFWFNLFHLVAGWTTAAANRPICAQMAQNPSERAQIVSLWLLLEKVSTLHDYLCSLVSIGRKSKHRY
mmetsp:Transcript_32989/g.97340  ORF Transcript_32989/g.97340 Transcript_32989/m.97340 type:complete len:426 (+) Transcript_32989:316-1593(+)